MENETQNVTSDTVARTIVLAIALINQVLAIYGREALPFTENDIYQLCSLIATIATSAWTWWRNNSFTQAALASDNYQRELKKKKRKHHKK